MNEFIIDNNQYIIAKDQNNNDVDNKRVQDIVFQIILEIDRICRKHKIDYALSFGSALGLYKYGDFIPWDDDADIVIDYFDYPRFVEALKSDLKDNFTFDCYLTNPRYNSLIPALKIRDKNTYVKEANRFTLPDHTKDRGLFVDVCLFMGVPKNRKEHLKLIKYSKHKIIKYVVGDAFLHLKMNRTRRKLLEFEKRVAEKYKNSDYVSQTVIIPFQDHPYKMVHSLAFPRSVIYPFKEYDFRGHKIYSFNNIEEFSRLRYGESALKKFDKSTNSYIETYPHSKKKSGHLKKIIFLNR